MKIDREVHPQEFRAPLFLTGCMRSGTTYLAVLLGMHKKIYPPLGELNHAWTQLGGLDCSGDRRYASRDELTTEAVVNMSAHFQHLYREYQRPRFTLIRMIDRYKYGTGGVLKDKDYRILNKSVHLINRVDYVLSMFQRSKMLLIIRPIEAQVYSLKLHFSKASGKYAHKPERAWDSWVSRTTKDQEHLWDFDALVHKWLDLNLTALKDLEKHRKERYFLIDFHDLVDRPTALLNILFPFMGLKLPASLRDGRAARRKVFNTHTKGNPLTAWREGLSEEEKDRMQQILKDRAADYQYIQDRLADYALPR